MGVEEKIVSNADGKTTENKGTIVSAGLYSFYVQNISSATNEISGKPIKMVLPVGGNLSGLYRLPRVGEKVLVDGNYLLGYLPGEGEGGTPFAPVKNNETVTDERDKLTEQQGMALRYKNSNKTVMEEGDYSEIGFYNAETDWKKSIDDTTYPKIDRISIQSTGDIHAGAQNHYQTRAKRFEILVNETPDKHKEEEDGGMLLAGDMRIKAGNRITIEAGDEIELKVGRSSITISDSGISMASTKGCGLGSSWDTSLDLDPLTGISMFGQSVDIGAVYNFSLHESFGGSVAGNSCMVGISGRIINLETIAKPVGIAYSIKNGVDLLTNIGTVSAAHHYNKTGSVSEEVAENAEKANKFFDGFFGNAQNLIASVVKPADTSGMELVVTIFDLILALARMVITVIDKKVIKTKAGRDALNLSALIIEYGYAVTVNSFLLYTAPLYANIKSNPPKDYIHHAQIKLDVASNIVMEAYKIAKDEKEEFKANSVLGGIDAKSAGIITMAAITSGVSFINDMLDYIEEPEIEEELKRL